MIKNVSGQTVSAHLVSKTDGSNVTTGTTTVYVTGDHGTQGTGGGTVTHEGNGEWSYVPTQAETNYTHIAFTFENTNAVGQTINVYTVGQDLTAASLTAILSAAGVQAIWDALTTALTTSGSIGKRIADNLTGDSYVRLGAPAGASIADDISNVSGGTLSIRPVKNAVFSNFMFPMYDATTKAPLAGLTVTAQRAIDGGGFASCANAVSSVGSGVYKIDLAAADLNGDKVMFKFTATGADVQLVELFTQG